MAFQRILLGEYLGACLRYFGQCASCNLQFMSQWTTIRVRDGQRYCDRDQCCK